MDKIKYYKIQDQCRANEDRYDIGKVGSLLYFAIFDGHGGNTTSESLSKYLKSYLTRSLKDCDMKDCELIKKVIKDVFIYFDKKMLKTRTKSGSTCTCVLIDLENEYIYQVNLGDSRTIIFNKDIIFESKDHLPSNQSEYERIKKRGGYVNFGRILGRLNISRAFGDFYFKEIDDNEYDHENGMVSCIPDIEVIKIKNLVKPVNILLSSDALFSSFNFTNKTLIERINYFIYDVYKYYSKEIPFNYILKDLVETIRKNGENDDSTIILISL